MARFSGEPVPGYAPVLRVVLREDPEGGPTLAQVREEWARPPGISQDELLLLIHGFNNHEREAGEAYQGMRTRQAPPAGDPARRAFDERLGDVVWPGDADWAGGLDRLDFLVYPQAVAVARDEVAPRLALYVAQPGDVHTVHVLAHSLGCRVALELMAAFGGGEGPAFGRVCLMAAAVPTFMLLPGGRLHAALARAREVKVLHSSADGVLAGAFPAGQTLASGDEGFFPIALGHAGDVPAGAGAVSTEAIDGAGHGDYWGTSTAPPSGAVADAVRAFFGFQPGGARALSARTVAAPRALAPRAAPA